MNKYNAIEVEENMFIRYVQDIIGYEYTINGIHSVHLEKNGDILVLFDVQNHDRTFSISRYTVPKELFKEKCKIIYSLVA